MARPLRNRDPERFWLITIRTEGARLWIPPSANVRKLIGGIIARYQELLSVEIYAYCVLGNHLHLLVRAPKGNLDEFCENVNREIARRLNWKHKREGRFWGRRYDAQDVLSEEDLLEAFLYITTNPTKHGLLQDSSKWPGLQSYQHSLKEEDRRFSFYHYSAPEGERRRTNHKLKLSVLPQFTSFSKIERRRAIERLLLERMEQIQNDRRANGQGFLGIEAILEQEHGSKPLHISRSSRPFCYTKCAELRENFRKAFRERRVSYDKASLRFRLGELYTDFPEFSFKPPLHRVPRMIPFVPLSPDCLKNKAA